MNYHYEDCPLREQALYVLDSRNQMLCGYYAFKETEFQRANLALIAKGVRNDGLLELTYPAINTPAIPFFSMMYPVAVYEYIQHTKDTTILSETMNTMLGIMNNFKSRIEKNGLIAEFEFPYWNFYEWSEGSSNGKRSDPDKATNYNLILNCAFVYSCTHFLKLCEISQTTFDIDLNAFKHNIQTVFYNNNNGLFFNNTDRPELYSQLGNSFAIIIGLGDSRTYKAIKEDNTLVPATLSMLGYVYDALLKYDSKNKEFILNDIRKKYGYMLNCGATTFWETLEGESAFGKMGSLCHGWSAMPIYYYHKFGICNT